MTWTIKTRGDGTAPILGEWTCPEHGTFEAIVPRAELDAQPCPQCGARSPWTISAPTIHQRAFVSCHRGKSDEKPFPTAMDTEPLADGKVTLNEWKKQRAEMWNAHEYDEFKKEFR